jgi:hypothetical protein
MPPPTQNLSLLLDIHFFFPFPHPTPLSTPLLLLSLIPPRRAHPVAQRLLQPTPTLHCRIDHARQRPHPPRLALCHASGAAPVRAHHHVVEGGKVMAACFFWGGEGGFGCWDYGGMCVVGIVIV